MFTAFQILTNPVGWLMSFFTFGVILTLAGVGLGAAAYLLPSPLARIRMILALAAAVSFGVAGGYYKGSGDCEAKHRFSELQEQIRVLQKSAVIKEKVHAASEAARSALENQLKHFDQRKSDVLRSLPAPLPAPAPAKGKCDAGGGLSDGATRGVRTILNPLR